MLKLALTTTGYLECYDLSVRVSVCDLCNAR